MFVAWILSTWWLIPLIDTYCLLLLVSRACCLGFATWCLVFGVCFPCLVNTDWCLLFDACCLIFSCFPFLVLVLADYCLFTSPVWWLVIVAWILSTWCLLPLIDACCLLLLLVSRSWCLVFGHGCLLLAACFPVVTVHCICREIVSCNHCFVT